MDDGYDACSYCGWAGKLRKDGTMRKHRVARDSGRIGSTGSLPQDPHGPACKGSGTAPWKVGLPEGYEVPPMNEHGGWDREGSDVKPGALPTLEDVELPTDEADREQARREAATTGCTCPRGESEVYAAHHRTVCAVAKSTHGNTPRPDVTTADVSESTWEAAAFDSFTVGDRIRFQTIRNGFGGSGDFVSRTGTVVTATARALTVQCDRNWLGDRAVLRRADWHGRDPQRVA